MVLAIGTNAQFQSFCEIIGRADLSTHPDFNENNQRVKNRVELKNMLVQEVNKMYKNDLLDQCLKLKVPLGEIKNLEQVMQNPVAQKMILEEEINGEPTQRLKSVAFKIEN